MRALRQATPEAIAACLREYLVPAFLRCPPLVPLLIPLHVSPKWLIRNRAVLFRVDHTLLGPRFWPQLFQTTIHNLVVP